MAETTEQPHIVKAILIYSDNMAVQLDYKDVVNKGSVSVMLSILWGGLEALGHMKRKEMNPT